MQRGAATCAVACAERIGPPQECTGLCLPVDWGRGAGEHDTCYLLSHARLAPIIIILSVSIVVIIVTIVVIVIKVSVTIK